MIVMLAGLSLHAEEKRAFSPEEQELLNDVWNSSSPLYMAMHRFAKDCGNGCHSYNPQEQPLCQGSLNAMKELSEIIKKYGNKFDTRFAELTKDREHGYQESSQKNNDAVTIVEGLNYGKDWHRVYTTFETEGDAASKLYVLSRHESEYKNGVRTEKIESQKLSREQLLLLKKRYADYQINGFFDESCQTTNKLLEEISKIVPVDVLLKQFEKDINQ